MWRRKILYATLLASLGTFGLAGTGAAQASIDPQIQVSSDLAGNTSLSYTQGASDDGAARVMFGVPLDYIATFSHQDSQLVGLVAARAVLGDSANQVAALSGQALGALGTDTMLNGKTIAAAAAACGTGSPAHMAYWLVNLRGPYGTTWQFPVVIDNLISNPAFNSFAGFAITACLPPSGVPVGTPGRAPLGGKIVELDFSLPNVFTVVGGNYTWHGLATPYGAGVATANPAAATEADGVDRVPPALSASGRKLAGGVNVSGRLTAGGASVAAQKVQILAGTKVIATVRTNGSGRFSATLKPGHKRLTASAVVAAKTGSCTVSTFAGVPCAGVTVGGFKIATQFAVR